MKRAFLIIVAGILLVGYTSCKKDCCINEDDIILNPICPQFAEPVCGCDGITYSNICYASAAGVTSYSKGACK